MYYINEHNFFLNTTQNIFTEKSIYIQFNANCEKINKQNTMNKNCILGLFYGDVVHFIHYLHFSQHQSNLQFSASHHVL